jgi:hypothetical protein
MIDWTQPIELDTVPPRPARVVRGPDCDGDYFVEADWPDRSRLMNDGPLYVNPDGVVAGFLSGRMARVRNVIAQPTEADPRDALIAELVGALKAAVDHIERDTCDHSETHRGGFLWEICDSCGRKWADDQGGKPEFHWPSAVINGRAAIAKAGAA